MVDSSLLTGVGFGCVGSASVNALVGPRRYGGASYHLRVQKSGNISNRALPKFWKSKPPRVGALISSLRISAVLCDSAVNALFLHIYRRVAENRRARREDF